MKKTMISLTDEERIALQVLIIMELKKNKAYKKIGIEPCFNSEELKNLYKKLANYE